MHGPSSGKVQRNNHTHTQTASINGFSDGGVIAKKNKYAFQWAKYIRSGLNCILWS